MQRGKRKRNKGNNSRGRGAAHLPGMVASLTTLPVIGVPVVSKLKGIDSLLSIVQMPKGIPVATVAVGELKMQPFWP
ncbi:5-(carboxyamino)imidazole ribonucleotide mutase [Caloramator sp. mosi_1]|uniref:AIR carboxylase family protein n=1 Tax=Caloramator sp. mosi_1 TaxID=3023090 RepID=UPI00235FE2CE|nr:AIR carboxylase family protein [Caloramator sp. mosi_1]WDC84509.1 5-(carboxyamino)imidazole ribonucleotide mutase [Caloramator sp. mosi_1]